MSFLLSAGLILAAIIVVAILLFTALSWRTVVPTNEIHTVQSKKTTSSYGKGEPNGNVYYKWPSWFPRIGVQTIVLPASVFKIPLSNYDSYDKDRLPFVIDVVAFFRIEDFNTAAQRIVNQGTLVEQLTAILQGSCRAILATADIHEILEGRKTFGDRFTAEVNANLKEWGITTVKCIELMEIRDAKDSKVIHQIMAKKMSQIDKESRIEVSDNARDAETREIENKRNVELNRQQAEEAVGIRTAEKEQRVGIAAQVSEQQIKEQERETMQKNMAVVEVSQVRGAEIAKAVQVVQAEQARETAIINAEGEKKQRIINAEGEKEQQIIRAEGEKQQLALVAEGTLIQQLKNADGIRAEGEAKGAAEQALLMAPVNSQLALAREIGENGGYQTYLISVKQVEANQAIGVEQAKALTAADIKIIVNSGDVASGVGGVTSLFTSQLGTGIGAALEGLAQTPVGGALVERIKGSPKGNGAAAS